MKYANLYSPRRTSLSTSMRFSICLCLCININQIECYNCAVHIGPSCNNLFAYMVVVVVGTPMGCPTFAHSAIQDDIFVPFEYDVYKQQTCLAQVTVQRAHSSIYINKYKSTFGGALPITPHHKCRVFSQYNIRIIKVSQRRRIIKNQPRIKLFPLCEQHSHHW